VSPILDSIGSVKAFGWGAIVSNTAYESIATVTVGAGGSASAEFTSIPQTYKHLQIRGIGRTSDAGTGGNFGCYIRMNSDTGSNYAFHTLLGNGISVGAGGSASQNLIYTLHVGPRGGDLSNTFSAQIVDILDYANTNKYKTVRILGGHNLQATTAERIASSSGVWMSVSAITRIDIYLEGTMGQYTQFALYGIKGSA
jgi:hypothetical protein